MSFFRTFLGSWALLGLAVCVWVGVCIFVWTIGEDMNALASSQTSVRAREEQRASASQLQSLARETSTARGELDALAKVDVVSMVDTIDKVGKDAGVYIQIGQALPEATKDSSIHAVNFQLGAEGSFTSLLNAIALLESLPIPASLEQVQLIHTGGNSAGPASWHMSLRLRILSTADISS